jgi:hypothetical protein
LLELSFVLVALFEPLLFALLELSFVLVAFDVPPEPPVALFVELLFALLLALLSSVFVFDAVPPVPP